MALTRLGLNQSVNLASNVTGTLPTANGGTGATSFAPGKILQVVQGTTDSSTSITSTSFQPTVITASITPSSSSSKVLCIAMGTTEAGTDDRNYIAIYRGTSNVVSGALANNQVSGLQNPFSVHYLDSPSTTSSTAYTVYGRVQSAGQTMAVGSGTMIMTLYEVSA